MLTLNDTLGNHKRFIYKYTMVCCEKTRKKNKQMKFFYVRELYGLSKADVAREFGLSQQLYDKYETGKTQRIPIDFIKKFARRYMVDEAWLLGEPAFDSSSSVSRAIGHRLAEASEHLRLPVAFLKAVCAGDVVLSDELYAEISRTYRVAKTYTVEIDDDGRQKELSPEDLLEIIYEKDKIIKNLNDYIALLKGDAS